MSPTHSNQLVDHLFRHESGRMVAVLTRIFGMHHLEMVEDVVQEAFIKALSTWKMGFVPDNPSAWLMQVARNRAFDILKQHKNRSALLEKLPGLGKEITSIDNLFHEQEMADSQLQLIFACCHPALKKEDQIALTLKTASGFGIDEIADALMVKSDTVRQRLHRAKKYIIEKDIQLEIPAGLALEERLEMVLMVLYLLFNEGYNATRAPEVIRKDLCGEAMRLTKILVEHPLAKKSPAAALLSLMCYHAARFDARIDEDGQIILLENQDTSKWNRDLIQLGHYYMKQSVDSRPVTSYHLEAAIACEHCMAPSFKEKDWKRLVKLYSFLAKIKPTPMVFLNLIVVQIQAGNFGAASDKFTELSENDFLGKEHLYYSVLADFYHKKGDTSKALQYLEISISFCKNPTERLLLEKKRRAVGSV